MTLWKPRIDTVNLLNRKKRKINVLTTGILNQMMLHNNIVSESEFLNTEMVTISLRWPPNLSNFRFKRQKLRLMEQKDFSEQFFIVFCYTLIFFHDFQSVMKTKSSKGDLACIHTKRQCWLFDVSWRKKGIHRLQLSRLHQAQHQYQH